MTGYLSPYVVARRGLTNSNSSIPRTPYEKLTLCAIFFDIDPISTSGIYVFEMSPKNEKIVLVKKESRPKNEDYASSLGSLGRADFSNELSDVNKYRNRLKICVIVAHENRHCSSMRENLRIA